MHFHRLPALRTADASRQIVGRKRPRPAVGPAITAAARLHEAGEIFAPQQYSAAGRTVTHPNLIERPGRERFAAPRAVRLGRAPQRDDAVRRKRQRQRKVQRRAEVAAEMCPSFDQFQRRTAIRAVHQAPFRPSLQSTKPNHRRQVAAYIENVAHTPAAKTPECGASSRQARRVAVVDERFQHARAAGRLCRPLQRACCAAKWLGTIDNSKPNEEANSSWRRLTSQSCSQNWRMLLRKRWFKRSRCLRRRGPPSPSRTANIPKRVAGDLDRMQ